MKILFCKVSAMKYYRGASQKDMPYNGGSYIEQYGFGNEQYNFAPVKMGDGAWYCLGFVETKTTSQYKRNDLHIERIQGCRHLKKEECATGVLVIWCATTDRNKTSIVGWYRDATVYRNYQYADFTEGYQQEFNIIAPKDECVLLPYGDRHQEIWSVPKATKHTYGFGQAMIWYATEEKATSYVEKLVADIEGYDGANGIDQEMEEEG